VKQVRGGLRQVLLTGTYAFFPHAFEILFRLDPAWGGRPLVHTLSTPAEGVRCLRVTDGPNGLPAGDASRQALVGLQTGARVRLVIVSWPPPGQPAMGR
jgi:hypothetical protein